jgi:hypothetical protein
VNVISRGGNSTESIHCQPGKVNLAVDGGVDVTVCRISRNESREYFPANWNVIDLNACETGTFDHR